MHHNSSDSESKNTGDKQVQSNIPIDTNLYEEGKEIIDSHSRWRRNNPHEKLEFNGGKPGSLILKATQGDESKAIALSDALDNLYQCIEHYTKNMESYNSNILERENKKTGQIDTIYAAPYLQPRKLYIQAIERLKSLGLPNDIRLGILNGPVSLPSAHSGLMRTPISFKDNEMVSTQLENGINPLVYTDSFKELLYYGGGAHRLERLHKCIELMLSHTLNFINDDNFDVLIKLITDMLASGKGEEQKNQSNCNSYEISTALALCMKKNIFPIDYQIRLLKSINIDEQPPLWPILEELEEKSKTMKIAMSEVTHMSAPLASIVSGYAGRELKITPNSELKERSLIKHVYMITVGFLDNMLSSSSEDRHAKILKMLEQAQEKLKTKFFLRRRHTYTKYDLKEFKVDTDLLMAIKNFIKEAQNVTVNPPSLFSKLTGISVGSIWSTFFADESLPKSPNQTLQDEWHKFVERNEYVLKEFNALLVKNELEPIESILAITSDSTAPKIAKI